MKNEKTNTYINFTFLVACYSFAQTTISDNTNISGNWTLANSPYIIEGRAIVPNGQTLTIEPGVEVRLRSSASPTPSWFDYGAGNVGVIRVEGEIIANGTTSNPIVFTRNNTGFWGTILLDENAATTSSFSNCIVEYAKESRNITGIASPVSFNGGISIYKSAATINQNEFRNNNVNGLYIREATDIFEYTNNTFYDNGSNGNVIEQSIVNAINNTYYNNSINASGQVAAIRSSNSTVYLVGNLIYNNDDFGIFTSSSGNHYIVNNTIFGNSQGIRIESGANTFIFNSIIQNNTLNFATSSVGGATIEMQYSATNDATFPTNVTNVSNNLLSSNALFTNAGANDFSLQNTSPVIDAGKPNTTGLNISSTDLLGNQRINNGIIDLGAIEFQQPVTNYTITTSSNPATGGTTAGGGTFPNGSSVTVSATANTGYNFINWTENGIVVSSTSDYTFTVTEDRDLVANFELIDYTITTSSNPSTGGTTSGGGTFSSGSSVTVSATSNTGYNFINWTENGTMVSSASDYTFIVTDDRDLVANFELIDYTITTSSNPTVGGTTSGGGVFSSGSNVTVSATANAGYNFINWTENGTEVSTSSSYSFTVSSDRNLVANFDVANSIHENANKDIDIAIYPNPTKGKIEIKTKIFSRVDIYDVLGKKIFSSNNNFIDLTSQPSGIYFLKITTSKGFDVTKRVIKN